MGAAVAHFGIRYANDLTDGFSEYVVDSVDLPNAQLASHDMSFFFDAVGVGLSGAPLSRGARQGEQSNSRRGRH